jgi:F-type H+-transporting ATPase subunit delta
MAAVSSRYARALADVITDQKIDAGQALEELRWVVAAFDESRELRALWETPALASEDKLRLLDALMERMGISERALRNFVAVLIAQDRIRLIGEIVEALEAELNLRAGRVEAAIISARPLGKEQQTLLEAQISQLTGKTVLPQYSTDEKLIGGVSVRVGSTIYDGSVRGLLERMRQQLLES